MKNFIKHAIQEKKITILFVVFILALGMYSYLSIPRQENPDIQSPVVQIVTFLPGASAELIEKQVTMKLEEEVAKLSGLESIKSFSQDNVSIIFALLKPNSNREFYDKQWQKLRSGIDDLEKDLPRNTMKPQISTDITDAAGIIISISSDQFSANELYHFAEDYKEKLSKLNGIRKVEISGNKEKLVEITLKEQELDTYNLSIEEVKQLILAQNVIIPVGSIESEKGKISIKTNDFFTRKKDFEEMMIFLHPQTGQAIRLRDIAGIEEKERENGNYFIKDFKPSILISAFFEENRNVVSIGKEVRDEIDKLNEVYPKSLQIEEILFLPNDVRHSVDSFIWNLLEGIAFVIVVIFIGMGIRNAIVVSFLIPLSIAITFIYMYYGGMNLNQVSISALIIALGMLVDNAIVISDASQENINAGMSNFEASYKGAIEQAVPILTSTLTTIAAFMPLINLPGSAGEFISSLPIIVIISLIASFVTAMLVTPAFTSMTLRNRTQKTNLIKPIQVFYTKLMDFNLKLPLISSVLILAIVAGCAWLALEKIGIKMFPYVDKDWVYVNIVNEKTGDIKSTEDLVLQADKILKSYPETTDSIDAIGGGLPRYYMMADYMMPAENNGTILAKFDLSGSETFHDRETFAYDLQQKLDQKIDGARVTAKLLEINAPGPDIEVRLIGNDRAALDEVAEPLYQWLSEREETINVQKIAPSNKELFKINIDDEQAFRFGLTRYEIQNQLNMALSGAVIGYSRDQNDRNVDIFIKTASKDVNELKEMKIKSSLTGKKFPINSFAEIVKEKSLDSIHRYNGEAVLSVSADIRPHYGSIQSELERYIDSLDTDKVEVHYGGDRETMSLYMSGLISASLLALGIIYLILLVQFKSITQPFIILITIPLAMIGVILALYFTGSKFTFTVGLGAASLMGIVVNNGILLIEYINRARKDGFGLVEACKNSVERRVRPILLSSITTICGLIPLAAGSSPFFKPMAIALMGGLISATFMTITVIPMIYFLFHIRER